MGRWIPLVGVLLAFWASLSGEFANPFLVASGLVTTAFIAWVLVKSRLLLEYGFLDQLRTAITYLPWLIGQVVIANVRVALVVWNPRLPIDPSLVEVPTQLKTPMGRVIYANSITLTPGTVSVDLGEGRILVHALTRVDREGVLDGAMEARVARLEEAAS